MFNFYQINKDNKIQTRDRLTINTLIPHQLNQFKLII
jgi:hypothetical protein